MPHTKAFITSYPPPFAHRWLFQSHDCSGCWCSGRIPELLPDRTGHNEEAALLNSPHPGLPPAPPPHTPYLYPTPLLTGAFTWAKCCRSSDSRHNMLLHEHSRKMTKMLNRNAEMWLFWKRKGFFFFLPISCFILCSMVIKRFFNSPCSECDLQLWI